MSEAPRPVAEVAKTQEGKWQLNPRKTSYLPNGGKCRLYRSLLTTTNASARTPNPQIPEGKDQIWEFCTRRTRDTEIGVSLKCYQMSAVPAGHASELPLQIPRVESEKELVIREVVRSGSSDGPIKFKVRPGNKKIHHRFILIPRDYVNKEGTSMVKKIYI